MLDLTARIAAVEERDNRRAELDRRDREHGGMRTIAEELAREEVQRERSRWQPHSASVTAADIDGRTAAMIERTRRETLQRLWIDCGAAVRRFAPKFKRDAAETLQSDALLLLVQWPTQGTAPSLDLGGIGGLPLRRDWRETVERADGRAEVKLTRAAWRALHAAVKQAAESPAARALAVQDAAETPTEDLDIAALVEQEQRDSGAATRLPDIAAPEIVSEILDIPLDAGRAIVARAFPAASTRDLAESWRISEQAAKNALTRGAAHVRKRYPSAADLLTDLDTVAARYRAVTESGAVLALLALRDDSERYCPADPRAARAAVSDYRATHRDLPAERAALLAACRAALRREGLDIADAAEQAERVAQVCTRLLPAEQRRARRVSSSAQRQGTHLPGASLPMADTALSGAHVTAETLCARRWTYGLTARDDRAHRQGESTADTRAAERAAERERAAVKRTAERMATASAAESLHAAEHAERMARWLALRGLDTLPERRQGTAR